MPALPATPPGSRPRSITVRGDLSGRAAAWDRLVDAAPVPTPYLRSWWLGAWPAGTLVFVCVEDGDTLLGGLVLRRVPGLTERYADVGVVLGASNLDVLHAPGHRAEVVAAIAGWASGGTRSFHVRAVAPDSALSEALPSARSGPFGETLTHPLTGDADGYLAARPKGLATRIRRARAQLEREGITYALLEGPDRVRAGYDRFLDQHRETFSSRSTLLPQARIARDAVLAGAAAGEAVAHALVRGDDIVAIEICFEVAGRVTLWHGSRQPDIRGAGNVLMCAAVRRAYALGHHELDIGYSGAPYKHEWADVARPAHTVIAASGRMTAAIAGLEMARDRVTAGLRHRWHERRHSR